MDVEGLLLKISLLTNLVEQMQIAHRLKDEAKFTEIYNKASALGFEIEETLQEGLENE